MQMDGIVCRRLMLALLPMLLVGCAHGQRPVHGTASAPSLAGRVLAVLPGAHADPARADQALAAAQLVATALEAMQPAVTVRDLEAMVEAGADCLLEHEPPADCLSLRYDGPWLEVDHRGGQLALVLHPGGDAVERALPETPVATPVETLGPMLMARLGLASSPPPREPSDAPRQTGACLAGETILEPFGSGIRALLSSARVPGDAAAADRVRAVAQLEQAYARSPDLLTAAWLARARQANGQRESAVGLLPDPMPAVCGMAPALAARGELRIALGERTEGVADLGRSAMLRPFNDRALHRWAEGLIQASRLEDANQVLRRVLAIEPARLDYRRRLADVLAAAGRPQEARSVLIQGLEHLPGTVDRAWIELDLAQLDEAASEWRRALLHGERGLALLGEEGHAHLRASLLNGVGVAALQLGNLDAAGRTLEQAIALRRVELAAGEPVRERLGVSLYNLGLVRAKEGRWAPARDALEESASLFEGEERTSVRLDHGRLLQQAQRPREALEVLDRVKRDVPPGGELEAEWLYLHGLSLAGVGRFPEAMNEVEAAAQVYEALELRLPAGLAWYNLALVAEKGGDSARAREGLERAREIAIELNDADSVERIEERLEGLERGQGEGR